MVIASCQSAAGESKLATRSAVTVKVVRPGRSTKVAATLVPAGSSTCVSTTSPSRVCAGWPSRSSRTCTRRPGAGLVSSTAAVTEWLDARSSPSFSKCCAGLMRIGFFSVIAARLAAGDGLPAP